MAFVQNCNQNRAWFEKNIELKLFFQIKFLKTRLLCIKNTDEAFCKLFSRFFLWRVHLFLANSHTGVNFINILRTAFMLTDPKSKKKTDGWNLCTLGICARTSYAATYIGEINPWCQFHQRHTRKKFVRKSFLAAFSSYVLALEKNSYEKCAHLTLMKLTAVVNFINNLRTCSSYESDLVLLPK